MLNAASVTSVTEVQHLVARRTTSHNHDRTDTGGADDPRVTPVRKTAIEDSPELQYLRGVRGLVQGSLTRVSAHGDCIK